MPWDGTELWLGELLQDGTITHVRRVAGGPDESIFQPEWSPSGVLHFVSDRTGWWNLYRANFEGGATGAEVEPLCEMEAEFGEPQWVFGMSSYAFVSDERIVCAYTERGRARLGVIDAATKELRPVETPYTDITYVRASPETGRVVFRGGRRRPRGGNRLARSRDRPRRSLQPLERSGDRRGLPLGGRGRSSFRPKTA